MDGVLCSQRRFRDWCMNRTGKIPFTVDRGIFELAINVALDNAKEVKVLNVKECQ
jgi:hypothetical protein